MMNFIAALQFGHFALRLRSSNKILQKDANAQRCNDARQSVVLKWKGTNGAARCIVFVLSRELFVRACLGGVSYTRNVWKTHKGPCVCVCVLLSLISLLIESYILRANSKPKRGQPLISLSEDILFVHNMHKWVAYT